MFQSKQKRIEQLEAQLLVKDRKINRLETLLATREAQFDSMQKAMDSTPSDCKPGAYCRACQFAKVYTMYDRGLRNLRSVYLCNKAGSCQHFIQKEVNE